jgi:hypothetical protein
MNHAQRENGDGKQQRYIAESHVCRFRNLILSVKPF